jgi:uncharacterized phiE125 gp8 family phage protein
MSAQCLVGPATEPASVAELRDWLKIDAADEDAILASLLKTARVTLEGWTRRAFVSQTWRFTYSGSSMDGPIRLPLGPLVSVAALRLYDEAGVETSVSSDAVELLPDDQRPAIRLVDQTLAAGARRAAADVVVGYGASAADTPAPLRQAILMLATCWHARRGDHAEFDLSVPKAVTRLVGPYRRMGLR